MPDVLLPSLIVAGFLAFFYYGFFRNFGVQRDPELRRLVHAFTDQSDGMFRIQRRTEMPVAQARAYEDLTRQLDQINMSEIEVTSGFRDADMQRMIENTNTQIHNAFGIPRSMHLQPRQAGRATAMRSWMEAARSGLRSATTAMRNFGLSAADAAQAFSFRDQGVNMSVGPQEKKRISPVEAWDS